jgi:hypothetical protein
MRIGKKAWNRVFEATPTTHLLNIGFQNLNLFIHDFVYSKFCFFCVVLQIWGQAGIEHGILQKIDAKDI